MENFSDCPNASYIFQAYTSIQDYAKLCSWISLILGIAATVANMLLCLIIPTLVKTKKLSFKRYAFVLNLAAGDLISSSFLWILCACELVKGETMFGDLVHGAFEDSKLLVSIVFASNYAPQIFYTVACVLQYVAICQPFYYSTKITKRMVRNLCACCWVLTVLLAPTIIAPIMTVENCILKSTCILPVDATRAALLFFLTAVQDVAYLKALLSVRKLSSQLAVQTVSRAKQNFIKLLGLNMIIYSITSIGVILMLTSTLMGVAMISQAHSEINLPYFFE